MYNTQNSLTTRQKTIATRTPNSIRSMLELYQAAPEQIVNWCTMARARSKQKHADLLHTTFEANVCMIWIVTNNGKDLYRHQKIQETLLARVLLFDVGFKTPSLSPHALTQTHNNDYRVWGMASIHWECTECVFVVSDPTAIKSYPSIDWACTQTP
jgi:hypothetical protein